MKEFPKPIKIRIFYDENLKEITGKDFEESIVSEGLSFAGLLYFIFSSYPEIQKSFSPGKLGMLLNGKRPEKSDILNDGDEVKFVGITG